MTELSAVLATACLFLLWRLSVIGGKLRMAELMLKAVATGRVVIRQKDGGVELEIKEEEKHV